MNLNVESEDILSDALEFLGGKPVVDDSVIRYGALTLTLAPKVRFQCPFRPRATDQMDH